MTELLDFLSRSPSRYHAAANLAEELERNGYTRLYETGRWPRAGGTTSPATAPPWRRSGSPAGTSPAL